MKRYTPVLASVVTAAAFFVPVLAFAAGPAPVDLLSISTNNFVIVSQTGVTNTGSHTSAITGNIGSSPVTAAAMNNVFCSEITGTIYGVDAAYVGSGSQTCFAGNPPLSNKTLVDTAAGDMVTAYNDAAGRTLPTATELGAGNIGGMTLAPGLYKWSTNVTIPTNLTLSGGPSDVWIFQIAGDLTIASGGSVPAGIKVVLTGGALASNVFWQVGGPTGATLGTYSTFNGSILSAKQVILQTGAVLNGRALAQTQVTLDANKVSSANAATIPPDTTLKVHILKYLDGATATAASANNYLFPMTATWMTANLNGGAQTSGAYTLGSNWGGAADLYGADTAAMAAPADYTTSEITDNTSQVVASLELCSPGKYLLNGYRTSAISFADAATQPLTTPAPLLTALTSDEWIIVDNSSCPTKGSLIVEKNTIGGNGTFKFTGDMGSFQITTTGNSSGGTGSSQTFSTLTPGTYHVSETAQNGWTMTDNECANVVVAAGVPTTCIVTNTKSPKLGEIRGTKFEDWDGDSSPFETKWEVGLSGWTIYLDTNNNGTQDSGEPSTVTDSHGAYHFAGLVAGTYHVREVQKSGWTQTYPSTIASSDKYDITLAAGQVAKKKDFGNFKLGVISGVKFNDLNANHHKDAGETGLAGWTINLKGPHGFTATTVTDANGTYSFANLAAGNYTLTEVMQPTWRQTLHPNAVTIHSSSTVTNKNFGNTQKPKSKGDKGNDDCFRD